MSLLGNKKDFEKALREAKDAIEALDQVIDDVFMIPLKAVINEYEIHYSSDIEEMITRVDELEDELAQLKDE